MNILTILCILLILLIFFQIKTKFRDNVNKSYETLKKNLNKGMILSVEYGYFLGQKDAILNNYKIEKNGKGYKWKEPLHKDGIFYNPKNTYLKQFQDLLNQE